MAERAGLEVLVENHHHLALVVIPKIDGGSVLLKGKFAPKDVIPVDIDPIRSPGQFTFERVVH